MQEKKFRDFIWKNFEKIIDKADIGITWGIQIQFFDYDERNLDETETEFVISPAVELKEVTLLVYDRVRKYYQSKQFDRIIGGLCHEVGHMVCAPLDELVVQPFKSEKEVEKIDELLATTIGGYLYKILNYGENTSAKRTRKHKKK